MWKKSTDQILSLRCPCLCCFSGTCQVLAVVNVMHRVRISMFSRPYTVGARIYLSRAGVCSSIFSPVKVVIHCPVRLLSSCVLRAISPLFSAVSCTQFSAEVDTSAVVRPRRMSTRSHTTWMHHSGRACCSQSSFTLTSQPYGPVLLSLEIKAPIQLKS